LIYQKFVILSIFDFHVFELSVGVILYPFTFLLTDLIAEFYGKEKASFCVKLAICMNILSVLIIYSMDNLEATKWSKVNNETFHKIFGHCGYAIIGSILACYISQLVDISLYLWIRKITKGRYLWMRNNFSTSISLFIDTSIVISFLTFFGILSADHFWTLISNSYSYKMCVTILSTPLFYLCVKTIKMLGNKSDIQ
jgi:uncharacterized integral membrane protein (TIGR00697 family)